MNQAVKTFIGMLAVIVIVLVTVLAIFEKSPLEKAIYKKDFIGAAEILKVKVQNAKDKRTCEDVILTSINYAKNSKNLDIAKDKFLETIPMIESACK